MADQERLLREIEELRKEFETVYKRPMTPQEEAILDFVQKLLREKAEKAAEASD